MVCKFIILILVGYTVRCFANDMEGNSGSAMTGKAVAFSYQVSCQEKVIQATDEAIELPPNLTKEQIRSLLDQLFKKAIEMPTAENVHQYILVQNAAKKHLSQNNRVMLGSTPQKTIAYFIHNIHQGFLTKPPHKKPRLLVASPRTAPRFSRSKNTSMHYLWT